MPWRCGLIEDLAAPALPAPLDAPVVPPFNVVGTTALPVADSPDSPAT